jgi:hypothetical protein
MVIAEIPRRIIPQQLIEPAPIQERVLFPRARGFLSIEKQEPTQIRGGPRVNLFGNLFDGKKPRPALSV